MCVLWAKQGLFHIAHLCARTKRVYSQWLATGHSSVSTPVSWWWTLPWHGIETWTRERESICYHSIAHAWAPRPTPFLKTCKLILAYDIKANYAANARSCSHADRVHGRRHAFTALHTFRNCNLADTHETLVVSTQVVSLIFLFSYKSYKSPSFAYGETVAWPTASHGRSQTQAQAA